MGAAIMQLIALGFFFRELKQLKWKRNFIDLLFKAAIVFFIAKNVLQAISAIPAVADLAYSHRNYTIAYLHMVLIGFISLGAFASLFKGSENSLRSPVKPGLIIFVIAFILTEIFLVLNAAGINIQTGGFGLQHLLFALSLWFPAAISMILYGCRRANII